MKAEGKERRTENRRLASGNLIAIARPVIMSWKASPRALLSFLVAPSLLVICSLTIFAHGERVSGIRPTINLEGAVGYDSNVFANANQRGDTYARLSPELQWLRARGLVVLDVRTGVDIFRFNDFSALDSEDFYGALQLSYPNRFGATTIGTLDLGWRERSSANEFIGTRVKSEVFDTEAGVRREVSEKLDARGSVSYSKEWVKTVGYSDREVWALGGDAIWIYSEKLSITGGYRYRQTRTEGRVHSRLNADDHLLRAGGEGQLMPKVTGTVTTGVQHRRFSDRGRSNTTSPYCEAGLYWNPYGRTRASLIVSKDFETTLDDRSVDHTFVRLGLDQDLYGPWSAGSHISYGYARFRGVPQGGRSDHFYGAGASLRYSFGSAAAILSYSYLNRDSDRAFFDYSRHRVELAGSFRF